MVTQYLEPFSDTRTSCTKDFAVALMLGRRNFDGEYPNYQVAGDPDDPDARDDAYGYFLEWLDTPVFDILDEEVLDIEGEKEDALEVRAQIKADNLGDKEQRIASVQQTIDDCKRRLVENRDTVRRARKYLRDIDDELANTVDPMLRIDTAATQRQGGTVCITLASLERWLAQKYPQILASATHAVATPPPNPVLLPDSLMDKKGGMSPTSTKNLLATFGILLEAFLKRSGSQFMLAGGAEVDLPKVAEYLSMRSLPPATPALPAEPLQNKKGGMSPASTKTFLSTFRILLEAFLEHSAGGKFRSDGGIDVKLQTVAKFLSEHSLMPASKLRYLRAQSVSGIEERIKAARKTAIGAVKEGQCLEAIKASNAALRKARAETITYKATKQ